eukprot:3367291-Prymnesium_polylepis.1
MHLHLDAAATSTPCKQHARCGNDASRRGRVRTRGTRARVSVRAAHRPAGTGSCMPPSMSERKESACACLASRLQLAFLSRTPPDRVIAYDGRWPMHVRAQRVREGRILCTMVDAE